MRTLLLMRGTMGSGKSTFIRENGLEPYTLSSDLFRLQVSNPYLNNDGQLVISQVNDTLAWEMLLNCLELRMKRGDFTVIDATHMSPYLVQKYKDLAKQYKYSMFYYQLNTDLKTCLARNSTRDKYKFVPEEAIKRCHEMIRTTVLPAYVTRINSLDEIINYRTLNLDKYKEVIVISDIHGCYDLLASTYDFNDETKFFVFLGDYVDRGIQNKEVLDFVFEHMNKKNFVFLEGNHEAHLRNYVEGDVDAVRSSDFKNNTLLNIYQKMVDEANIIDKNGDKVLLTTLSDTYINDKDREVPVVSANMRGELKRLMKDVYRKLYQCFAFEFRGQKYLCTHGGLNAVPNLAFISTKEMTSGVGKYDHDVSETYKENYLAGNCQGFIQLYGHRPNESNEYSYCLMTDNHVENGGEMLVAEITDKINIRRFENLFVEKREPVQHQTNEDLRKISENFTNEDTVDLVRSSLVHVKPVKTKNNTKLLSVHFKDKVFFQRKWNSTTIRARGLFLYENGDVAMRSYNKFFNMHELPSTSKKVLSKTLQFPVKAWKKDNGFLGIASVVNGEFQLATKRTLSGQFYDYFAELWDKENDEFKQQLIDLSKKYNCSFVFEVLHEKDPHMIEYEFGQYSGKLIVLDAVENKAVISENSRASVNHEFSQSVCSQIDYSKALLSQYKELVGIIDNSDELWKFIDEQYKTVKHEGFVFEDKVGFLFKVKCHFYSKWKSMRGLVHVFIATETRHQPFPIQKCRTPEEIQFIEFLRGLDLGVVQKNKNNIIALKKMFLNS